MNTGTIYMYTSPSNKRYIGQTRNEQRRKSEHFAFRSKNPCFHAALKKYGKDSFKYEVLHRGIESQDELDALERKCIAEYNTIAPNGYNLTDGGSVGKHNAASIQKLKDMWLKKEKRDQMVRNMKKTANSPEGKKRLREAALSGARNKDSQQRKSEKLIKAFAAQEVRALRSKQRAEEWGDPEIRAKRVAGLIAANSTEEKKEQKSKIMLERWQDEKYRAEMIKQRTGRKMPRDGVERARAKMLQPVMCVETGVIFQSAKEAAQFAGVTRSSVAGVLAPDCKFTAGGFHWKKVEKNHAP